ncbi:MAG: hypothetical protein IT569_02425 [Leptospiraceae bacterium]|nr:hypothetical protein [Leptospiraceae bacterium]
MKIFLDFLHLNISKKLLFAGACLIDPANKSYPELYLNFSFLKILGAKRWL